MKRRIIVTSAVIVLLSCLASVASLAHAGFQVRDPGLDGIQQNPLVKTANPGINYQSSSTASPFSSRAFGTSTMSNLLDDTTTSQQAYATSPLTVQNSDWVLVQFDFRLSGTDWSAGEFWAGRPNEAAVKLGVQGSSFAVYGRRNVGDGAAWILLPQVTAVTGQWYHVDVVVMPYNFSGSSASNDRTYTVTVTQLNGSTPVTGSRHHILYESSGPMTEVGFGNLESSSFVHSINIDNFAVETLDSTSYVIQDGCGDASPTPLNPLVKVGTDGTYTAVNTQRSNILTNRFGASSWSGDLNDNTNAAKPRIHQTTTPMGNTAKDWVHSQFDFRFGDTSSMSQWSFVFADNSALPVQGSSASPNAFELRVQTVGGLQFLTVYGRTSTTGSWGYQSLGIPAVTNGWYRVDVYFRPSYLTGNDRTYTVGVTLMLDTAPPPPAKQYQYNELTLLNEDAGVISDFNVFTTGTSSKGHVYVDNVLVERLTHLSKDLRYGYYPSANSIRAFVKYAPFWAKTWQFDVVPAAGGSSLKTLSGSFPFKMGGETLTGVPTLTDGASYKLRLTLSTGVTGDNADVTERTFEHHDFVWENAGLGTDNTVLPPPFTAMVTNTGAGTVDCVLRTHTMASTGLWNQVASEGTQLLTGPVALSVVDGGSTYTAGGSGLSFTLTQPYDVAGTGTWSAGPHLTSRTTSFDFDYDGLMRVTLNLGTVPTSVSSMYLDIPLAATEAKYMKVVTDSVPPWNTPGHLGQSVPQGTGSYPETVWDSANVWRNELPAPFVPYIWIGGAERGVAFMAENAKDWSLDPTAPIFQLIRTSASGISLRVRLFTTAPSTARSRTISFALMATPAKPMPTSPTIWRNLRFVPPVQQPFWDPPRRVTSVLLPDGTLDQGAQSEAMSYYPAFQNFGLFDEYVKVRNSGLRTANYVDNRMTSLFSGSQYDGNPYNDAPTGPQCPNPSLPNCIRQSMWNSVDYGLSQTTQARNADSISDVIKDGMEGTPISPLLYDNGGDASNSYNGTYTGSVSPFTSVEFPSTSAAGLLTDNSSTTTPFLYRTGLGVTSSDYVRLAFDLKTSGAAPWQWDYLLGDTYGYPFAFSMGFQGSQFRVVGRRKLTETIGPIYVPNVVYAPDTWYHVEAILKPSGNIAAERTYDLRVASRNADGSWTTGTLRGILNEDSGPIDGFWIRNSTYGDSGTGSVTVDNVLLSKVKPEYLFAYTNSRGTVWDKGAFNETYTYMDEWSIYDPADPRWDAVSSDTDHFNRHLLRENAAGYDEFTGVGYDTEPVPSHVDMALYYISKMYDSFLDGIYWDNWFLRANYSLVGGPGYVGDDGRLYPGVSLYTFRSYAKRNMIMQYQRGMRPNAWIHMSNTHIVPIDSFGTINFDWEWIGPGPGAGWDTDHQTSFHLDGPDAPGTGTGYVIAQATGFQSGNVGLMLDESVHGSNDAIRTHLRKSELAIALVHEFKVWMWQSEAENADKALESFGYGLGDCTVYRYWDGAQPITASGEYVKLLVLKRPGSAFVVVSGFDPNPANVTLTVDAAALGLPAGWQAYDDTDGPSSTTFTVNGNQVTIPSLPVHEFRLVRLQ